MKHNTLNPRTQIWWSLGAIMLVAVLLRLLVFSYIAHEPRKFYTYDSDGYDQRAINLLTYGMFAGESHPPLTPDLDRTPIYPGLLALVFLIVGHSPVAVVLIQILLGSLTAVLAFMIIRDLGLPIWAGLLAALIVAIDPVSLMTSNRLLTETLFTTLLTGAVWLLVRFWRTQQIGLLLLAALLFGLTALTRPISQVLPLALLPLFALAARRQRLQALLTYGLLFVVLSTTLTYSWAYRNYVQTGVFTLSTISDTNLIYYRARAVLAEAEGSSQDAAWAELEQRINTQAAQQKMTPEQKLELQRAEALAIFRQHPFLTLTMFLKGIARIFVDPGFTISCTLLDRNSTAFDCFPGKSSMNEPGQIGKALGKIGHMTVVQQLALIWSAALLALVYCGAALGIIQLIRQRHWLALAVLLTVIGYFVLLAAGAEANSRFRIPAVPFMAALAGVGLHALATWYRAWRKRATAEGFALPAAASAQSPVSGSE